MGLWHHMQELWGTPAASQGSDGCAPSAHATWQPESIAYGYTCAPMAIAPSDSSGSAREQLSLTLSHRFSSLGHFIGLGKYRGGGRLGVGGREGWGPGMGMASGTDKLPPLVLPCERSNAGPTFSRAYFISLDSYSSRQSMLPRCQCRVVLNKLVKSTLDLPDYQAASTNPLSRSCPCPLRFHPS